MPFVSDSANSYRCGAISRTHDSREPRAGLLDTTPRKHEFVGEISRFDSLILCSIRFFPALRRQTKHGGIQHFVAF